MAGGLWEAVKAGQVAPLVGGKGIQTPMTNPTSLTGTPYPRGTEGRSSTSILVFKEAARKTGVGVVYPIVLSPKDMANINGALLNPSPFLLSSRRAGLHHSHKMTGCSILLVAGLSRNWPLSSGR